MESSVLVKDLNLPSLPADFPFLPWSSQRPHSSFKAEEASRHDVDQSNRGTILYSVRDRPPEAAFPIDSSPITAGRVGLLGRSPVVGLLSESLHSAAHQAAGEARISQEPMRQCISSLCLSPASFAHQSGERILQVCGGRKEKHARHNLPTYLPYLQTWKVSSDSQTLITCRMGQP